MEKAKRPSTPAQLQIDMMLLQAQMDAFRALESTGFTRQLFEERSNRTFLRLKEIAGRQGLVPSPDLVASGVSAQGNSGAHPCLYVFCTSHALQQNRQKFPGCKLILQRVREAFSVLCNP